MAEIINFRYPSNIGDDSYTFKRMLIRIYEATTLTEVGDALVTKLKEISKATVDLAKTDSTASLEGNIRAAVGSMASIKELNGKFITSISLPIPNELSDDQTHNYDQQTGFVGFVADKTGISALANEVVSRAANHMGAQKVMANPQYFQNYMGSGPRSFNFNFKFIPESYEEGQQIINIINIIKKYSSPDIQQDDIMMVAPNFFNIEFSNSVLQDTIRMKPCVLADIKVNYTATGVVDMMLDGMPKYITLSLTFKEIKASRQSDFIGVGVPSKDSNTNKVKKLNPRDSHTPINGNIANESTSSTESYHVYG